MCLLSFGPRLAVGFLPVQDEVRAGSGVHAEFRMAGYRVGTCYNLPEINYRWAAQYPEVMKPVSCWQ